MEAANDYVCGEKMAMRVENAKYLVSGLFINEEDEKIADFSSRELKQEF
jgi:hypothetical protein